MLTSTRLLTHPLPHPHRREILVLVAYELPLSLELSKLVCYQPSVLLGSFALYLLVFVRSRLCYLAYLAYLTLLPNDGYLDAIFLHGVLVNATYIRLQNGNILASLPFHECTVQ